MTVADTLLHLGDVQHAAGDLAAARTSWNQALATFVDLGHADAGVARDRLAGLSA